ncbi:DUF1036 domain-containing protein [Nostoc sp. DSM 114161]|jgi:hypothetical protein|uniref:hypothetical protein n=1 Tax=Nostoc sp. DSM 114161 TaxID=3440143 RepID=UPI004045F5AA
MTDIKVDTQKNTFLLEPEVFKKLEKTAASSELEPGLYVIRIKSGSFNYWGDSNKPSEPFVLLWIYGKFINLKTNIEVPATWTTLNGYDDTLTIQVVEKTTVSALFFDTNVKDNAGELVVSILPA